MTLYTYPFCGRKDILVIGEERLYSGAGQTIQVTKRREMETASTMVSLCGDRDRDLRTDRPRGDRNSLSLFSVKARIPLHRHAYQPTHTLSFLCFRCSSDCVRKPDIHAAQLVRILRRSKLQNWASLYFWTSWRRRFSRI
jgi:hypothetical protein